MSFEVPSTGEYGGDLIEKAREASGVGELLPAGTPLYILTQSVHPGERRSVSPRSKKSQTSPRQSLSSRSSSRKSKSPLSHSRSHHTPAGSPPLPQPDDPVIDPDLLDAAGEPDQVLDTTADKTDLHLQGEETARMQDKQWKTPLIPQQLGAVPQPGRQSGLPAWGLRTSNLHVESQPPSSVTGSPETPTGLGLDAIYANQPYDSSRQSSMTDLESYVAATKGISTNASSDSGYDLGGYGDPNDLGGPGVPPPKEKKSHARKVRRRSSEGERG